MVKLQKPRPQSQKKPSKPNILRKFGHKFRKAFIKHENSTFKNKDPPVAVNPSQVYKVEENPPVGKASAQARATDTAGIDVSSSYKNLPSAKEAAGLDTQAPSQINNRESYQGAEVRPHHLGNLEMSSPHLPSKSKDRVFSTKSQSTKQVSIEDTTANLQSSCPAARKLGSRQIDEATTSNFQPVGKEDTLPVVDPPRGRKLSRDVSPFPFIVSSHKDSVCQPCMGNDADGAFDRTADKGPTQKLLDPNPTPLTTLGASPSTTTAVGQGKALRSPTIGNPDRQLVGSILKNDPLQKPLYFDLGQLPLKKIHLDRLLDSSVTKETKKRNISCPPDLPLSPRDSEHSDSTLVESPSPRTNGSSPSRSKSSKQSSHHHQVAHDNHWVSWAEHLHQYEQDISEVEWQEVLHAFQSPAIGSELVIARETIIMLQNNLVNQKQQHQAESDRLNAKLDSTTASLIDETERRQNFEESLSQVQDEVSEVKLKHSDLQASKSELEAGYIKLEDQRDLLASSLDNPCLILGLGWENQNLQDEKQSLESKVEDLEDQNQEVHRMLGESDTSARTFEHQFREADLEVGRCHQVNFKLRNTMEDTGPAQVNDMESIIRQKDTEYQTLAEEAIEYRNQLFEEKQAKALEQAESNGTIKGLENELEHCLTTMEEVMQSRNTYKTQVEEVLEMLRGKLGPDDILTALSHDNEVLRKDNRDLIDTVNNRRRLIAEAQACDTSQKMTIIELEGAAVKTFEKHQDLEADYNSLVLKNSQFTVGLEMPTEEEDKAKAKILALEAANEDKEEKTQQLIEDYYQYYPAMLASDLAERDNTIKQLKKDLSSADRKYKLQRNQTQKMDTGFCHFIDADKIEDWQSEEIQNRLVMAERRVKELEENEALGTKHIPHATSHTLSSASTPPPSPHAEAMSNTERMFGSKVFHQELQWNTTAEYPVPGNVIGSPDRANEEEEKKHNEQLAELYGPDATQSVWDQYLGGNGRMKYSKPGESPLPSS